LTQASVVDLVVSQRPQGRETSVFSQVTRTPQPENAAHQDHERNDYKRRHKTAVRRVLANPPNDRRGNDVAQDMDNKDVQRKGVGPDGRMRDVGQYGVRRTGVEEKTKDRDKYH